MSQHVNDIQMHPVKSTIMLGIPIILLFFLDSLYSVADVYWVSGLGTAAIICMGFISNIIYAIDNLGDGIGRSCNVLISNAFGANQIEKTEKYAEQGLLLILLLSIVIPFVTIPFVEPICVMAGISEYTDMIFAYLAPCLCFVITIMINNFFCAVLASEGDTARSSIIVAAGNILNIILDPILIFYFKMGMLGAAVSIVFGGLLSILLFVYIYSIKKDTLVKVHLKGFRLDLGIIREIIVLAIPIIITSVIITALGIVVTYSLHLYASPIAVSAYIILLNVQSTVFSPIQGIMKGLCIVTGHLNGAKRFIELRWTIRKIFSMCFVLAIAISIALAVFHGPIVGLFSSEYVILEEVKNMLLFTILYMITFPIIMGCSYVFLGLEKSTYTLMFLIFNLIIMIISMISFNHIFGLNKSGIFLSIILSNTIEAIVMIAVLKRMLDSKIENSEIENRTSISIGD